MPTTDMSRKWATDRDRALIRCIIGTHGNNVGWDDISEGLGVSLRAIRGALRCRYQNKTDDPRNDWNYVTEADCSTWNLPRKNPMSIPPHVQTRTTQHEQEAPKTKRSCVEITNKRIYNTSVARRDDLKRLQRQLERRTEKRIVSSEKSSKEDLIASLSAANPDVPTSELRRLVGRVNGPEELVKQLLELSKNSQSDQGAEEDGEMPLPPKSKRKRLYRIVSEEAEDRQEGQGQDNSQTTNVMGRFNDSEDEVRQLVTKRRAIADKYDRPVPARPLQWTQGPPPSSAGPSPRSKNPTIPVFESAETIQDKYWNGAEDTAASFLTAAMKMLRTQYNLQPKMS